MKELLKIFQQKEIFLEIICKTTFEEKAFGIQTPRQIYSHKLIFEKILCQIKNTTRGFKNIAEIKTYFGFADINLADYSTFIVLFMNIQTSKIIPKKMSLIRFFGEEIVIHPIIVNH